MRSRRTNGSDDYNGGSKRFIGYIRVNTAEQGESDLGLADQRKRIKGWAAAEEHTLVAIEKDVGVSGTVAPEKRPGLSSALDALRRGDADGLVAVKLDRFSRSVSDALSLATMLKKKRKHLACVSEKIDTSTASGKLFLNMLAAMAQWERDVIAERTTAALAEVARQGRARSRFTPFGYHTDSGGTTMARGNSGKLVKDAEEQKTLRRMLALDAKGLVPQAIADKLNDAGRRTRGGKKWYRQLVYRILAAHDERQAAIDVTPGK
jgi:DNA invertase Pin-like site-specific DNA recombinase